jgi:glutathione peroxidase
LVAAVELIQTHWNPAEHPTIPSRPATEPQYAGLEQLHERFRALGFSVLGVPCNQFGGQEPGSADEIATFCSATYGVTFPLTEKVDVNGGERHPLYTRLTATADAEGKAGDVQWNFEKFLVSPDGSIVTRFRPQTAPLSDEVVAAIESVLPPGGSLAAGRVGAEKQSTA